MARNSRGATTSTALPHLYRCQAISSQPPAVTPEQRLSVVVDTAIGPGTGQGALLTDPGFILEPDFEWPATHGLGQGLIYVLREVFLNASCAAGSDLGCWGRTDTRRNPSADKCLPTVRTCIITPKRSSILRLRSTRRHRTTPSAAGSGPLRTQVARSAFCVGFKRQDDPHGRRFDRPGKPSAL